MKNLFLSLLAVTSFLMFASCDRVEEENVIDKITIVDKHSNVVNEYLYDVTNGGFMGEQAMEKQLVINGTVVEKKKNSSGGHNYRCSASSDVCYQSRR